MEMDVLEHPEIVVRRCACGGDACLVIVLWADQTETLITTVHDLATHARLREVVMEQGLRPLPRMREVRWRGKINLQCG